MRHHPRFRFPRAALLALVLLLGGCDREPVGPSVPADLAAPPSPALAAAAPLGPVANGKIAFDASDGDDQEIYAINPDGSGLTQLTNNDANDNSPDWSPDGSQIAFTSQQTGPQLLWVMNADGTG